MASTILADNGVSSGSAGIKTTADSTGALALQTTTAGGAATTAVTIDTSQNVGIGAGSPSTFGKLAVNVNTNQNFYASNNSNVTEIGSKTNDGSGYNSFSVSGYDVRIKTNNGTERARFDENGNVGIGTSSPQINSSGKTIHLHAAGTGQWSLLHTTNGETGALAGRGTIFGQIGTDAYVFNYEAGNLLLATNSAERARIDSSGNFLVGLTSAIAAGTVSNTAQFVSSAQGFNIVTRCSGSTSGKYWHQGPDNNNNLVVYNQGNVGVYITDGGTSWLANSDERLKTALTPFENAAQKVCSLRAGTGRYLTDDESVSRSFLIAQDVQAVLPEAVNVQSDEIGTLGLSYTDLIPLLTAAIQEQQALINNLTERLAALEAK